jgi:restriction endonuclease S subunit
MFKAGQILYVSRRTYLHKVAVPHFDGICANTTFVIEPTGRGLLPELLPFVMQSSSFNEHAVHESRGSTNPYVNWKDIAKYKFDVPASLDIQKRIAQTLLAAEDYIQKQESLIEATENFSQILGRELLFKGIQHEKFKETEIGMIPVNWDLVKLRDICTLVNGRAFKASEWSSYGIPIIRIQNLNDRSKSFNYFNFDIEKKFLVDSGQLLFAWSGTPETSFGAHIWKGGKAAVNQHIFKVMIDEAYIDKFFLLHVLNRNVAEYVSKAHGSAGLAHITKSKFENSLIALPPLAEQQRIAAIVTHANDVIKKCKQTLETTMALKMALIDHAFSKTVSE